MIHKKLSKHSQMGPGAFDLFFLLSIILHQKSCHWPHKCNPPLTLKI